MAAELGAGLVVLDPALPLGLIGPSLALPYDVVLHGAEVTVPGRLPGSRALLAHVLRRARRVVSAGGYPAAEGERAADRTLDVVNIPPGVDVERFRPLDARERTRARARFGLPAGSPLVVSVSRLVPRKGFDTLIRAAARLRARVPNLHVAISGGGRDEARLRRLASELGVAATFLGRVADEDLPSLYGGADVFAMVCRNRWAGLEQEGFGIVFLEAAACGIPQVAGASGGAAEAVLDGETGLVVDPPDDPDGVAEALAVLFHDPPRRARLGRAARERAVAEFTYDGLARRLGAALGALP
jgi:phosphatidylinositol alpha-1,6-mannosyltransferase